MKGGFEQPELPGSTWTLTVSEGRRDVGEERGADGGGLDVNGVASEGNTVAKEMQRLLLSQIQRR